MDAIDRTLLSLLATDGRTTFAELAERVSLSSPSTAERVRRLENTESITGYHATVDPAALGLDLTAFLAVTLDTPSARGAFLAAIDGVPEIVECHHVAGDDDYLLKVFAAGTRGLEALVSDTVKAIPGVMRTRTTIVLSTTIERPYIPTAP